MEGTVHQAGDLRTRYQSDRWLFATRGSRIAGLIGVIVLCILPLQIDGLPSVSSYWLALIIQMGCYGIAALGLNILFGFTGQISFSQAAFFGFGAFASAYLSGKLGVPVVISIPLAGVATACLGAIICMPARRLKALYVAIATLAVQFIIQDFFSRAEWFTGGVAGAKALPFSLFGVELSGDRHFLYVVLFFLVVMSVFAANLMRTRDGRALVAMRDHSQAAEMMGIHLAHYRTLAFAIASFYAGIGGALLAHHTSVVSIAPFDLLASINLLAMVIIGGLASVPGSLIGAVFMLGLPELTQVIARGMDFTIGSAYIKEMAIGLAILLFLIVEPDGIAARWRNLYAKWRR
ncbi:MAG: branched-chain amino acid ABC transporter permease [Burkholderiales bacterium]